MGRCLWSIVGNDGSQGKRRVSRCRGWCLAVIAVVGAAKEDNGPYKKAGQGREWHGRNWGSCQCFQWQWSMREEEQKRKLWVLLFSCAVGVAGEKEIITIAAYVT